VLQPLQVRSFAKLHLGRAKTDRIDASLIAACTHALEPQARTPDRAWTRSSTRIARLKTRLEHIHGPWLREIVSGDIKTLRAPRADQLRRLLKAVREQVDLAKRLKLVLSVPGIGACNALTLILRMPELGNLSREQAAALAGLAPFVQQSGRRVAEPTSPAGERLRRSLYAAALAATFRWNPVLKGPLRPPYPRGKAHTVALVACARKLPRLRQRVLARGIPRTGKPAAA
jgi:transposase